jgi:hypothetical protein
MEPKVQLRAWARRPARAGALVLLACLALVPWLSVPPAAGAQAVPADDSISGPAGAGEDAGLRLVKTILRQEVWLLDGRQRRWIADLATFSARGYRWEQVEIIAPAILNAVPVGPADHTGALLRLVPGGEVYLVADGQARLVPDLLSFEAYGLDWNRVQPVQGPALAGTPRGPALPHAVTGAQLPAAPRDVPAGSGRGQQVDERLRAPLALMAGYPPTADFPAFLTRYGVHLRVAPVEGGLASYRATDRTLTVDPRFAGADPRSVATLLVHETLHAIFDASGRSGKSGRACVDEEAQAFAAQAAFWASHHGRWGMPEATEPLEQELNRVLMAAQDDALAGTVITTWAYTLRCYFPDAGGAAGDGAVPTVLLGRR